MALLNPSTFFFALCLTLTAFPSFASERHNIVLLVPEALPPAAVNHDTAPALARFRSEGVYFSNSHSGFPVLASNGTGAADASTDLVTLVATASQRYSTAFIDDTQPSQLSLLLGSQVVEEGPRLEMIVNELLPRFQRANRPFLLVYRFSRSERGASEEARAITIRTGGLDDPALIDAARTADSVLVAIEGRLRELGLFDTTNVVIAAQRGISFTWKVSATSQSRMLITESAQLGTLEHGFLAMDLTATLAERDPGLRLFDPENGDERVDLDRGERLLLGSGAIGVIPWNPLLSVEPRGDHGFIYLSDRLPKEQRRRLARLVVDALFRHDYTGGVFVNEARVGRPRGSLPLKHIGWQSDAGERVPDVIVTFVSKGLECSHPTLCTAVIADTPINQAQQLPGSFSRADTWNFMAARGPDFQSGLDSGAPASSADLVRTVRELLGLPGSTAGTSTRARVLTESLFGNEGSEPTVRHSSYVSRRSNEGGMTEVRLQSVGDTLYFDAAGHPGNTVGIDKRPEPWRWALHLPRPKVFSFSFSTEDVKFEPFPSK